MLSYFGCDQSQVQRYLTAQVGRRGPPLAADERVREDPAADRGAADRRADVRLLRVRAAAAALQRRARRQGPRPAPAPPTTRPSSSSTSRRSPTRRTAADAYSAARSRGADAEAIARPGRVRRSATPRSAGRAPRPPASSATSPAISAFGDINYVFPTFVTTHMPIGLVGLIIAAIFAASMSTVAAELNSLATATVIDFYRRLFVPRGQPTRTTCTAAKVATAVWGLFACVVALFAANLGPLIDVVNRFGSFFYGSILGVFVLALGVPRATGARRVRRPDRRHRRGGLRRHPATAHRLPLAQRRRRRGGP